MPSETAIGVYVGFSIVIIGVLVTLLFICNNKSCSPYTPTDMCLCDGFGGKICTNRQELKKSYDQGNTEYQKFQKPPGFWRSTDFDKY